MYVSNEGVDRVSNRVGKFPYVPGTEPLEAERGTLNGFRHMNRQSDKPLDYQPMTKKFGLGRLGRIRFRERMGDQNVFGV